MRISKREVKAFICLYIRDNDICTLEDTCSGCYLTSGDSHLNNETFVKNWVALNKEFLRVQVPVETVFEI
jgi:hypothetical protein